MGKEDNLNVDKEEMPKIGNHKVKTIIICQCSVDIVKYFEILNLIGGIRQKNDNMHI